MQITTQFSDAYGTTRLPALQALTLQMFNEYPLQYPDFFRVSDTTSDIEQDLTMAGFGLFEQVPEGMKVGYDRVVQGFRKTYQPVDYGRGYLISHQLKRDDRFRLVGQMAGELGDAARNSQEVEIATDYNDAFTSGVIGPDGKVLCATDHPNEDGGTQANRPTNAVDLDVDSLEAALTTFAGWTDGRGKLRVIPPETLVVPRALEFQAARILGGNMQYNTAEHTINAFQQRSGYGAFNKWKVYNFLTDLDSWFVIGPTSKLGLRVLHREKFYLVHGEDFETRGIKTAGWYALDHGWSYWQGLYGVPGL